MKTISLLLALFTVVQAKQIPTAFTRALHVRGGGELGPLDGSMAMQLSKTAATAYVAGAASKYIATQSGGSGTQLADAVTTDLFQTQALCTAVACSMYGLGSTGFNDLKLLAASSAVALLLRFDSGGFNVDTVKANKAQAVITAVLLFVAFVK